MGADAWGVDEGYDDTAGVWHAPSAETSARLRIAMGADESTAHDGHVGPPEGRPLRVVRPDSDRSVGQPCDLVLEDGTELRVEDSLPPDLPLGYHELRPPGGGPTTLVINAPARCHLPDDLRSWVLTVQLHACRSARSWGIGDLGDLWRIGTWATVRGADMVALNPLHAPLPVTPVQASPYFPSSRRWRSPLLLQVDEIPGAADDADVAELSTRARGLSQQRLLDRDAVWRLKLAALERLWSRRGSDQDERLERWRADQGQALEVYARFCALAEHHGAGWSQWPDEHRHPAKAGVARFAADHADRVAFWAWLQLLVDDQLTRAGEALPLLHDLAIGVDPEGAEAWAYQDLLALDARVGAPPDDFNPNGQDWGLPPFVPWKLRDAGYAPLAELWRSGLSTSAGGGLRIDHVMGLFRLFWLLPDHGPAEGAYVRYPADELLAVLAVESVRAGALVVGEDLGTVEPGVRETLADAGVLSSRVLWFEGDPPERYPAQALATVTTHDLPTVAGVWSGEDVADQRAAGLPVDDEAASRLRHKLAQTSGCASDAPVEDVVVEVHRQLGAAPSMLVGVTLEDALAVTQRPNMPGTTSERPNWSLALPLPLEEILADPLVNQVAVALRVGRRRATEPPEPSVAAEPAGAAGAAEPEGATEPAGAAGAAEPEGATEPAGAAGAEVATEPTAPAEADASD